MEYSKELLEPIVQRVFTYSDVCRELGLNPHFSRRHSHAKGVTQNRPMSEILVENSTYANTNSLRRRPIKEGFKECKCEASVSGWVIQSHCNYITLTVLEQTID